MRLFNVEVTHLPGKGGYARALQAAVDTVRAVAPAPAAAFEAPTLMIIALPVGAFGSDRWFDLTWAIPTAEKLDDGDGAGHSDHDPWSEEAGEFWDGFHPSGWHVISRIGHLPAPSRVPAEQRAIPVDTDAYIAANPSWDRFWNSRDELEAQLLHEAVESARRDFSAETYLWGPLAARVLQLTDTLTPPKLAPIDKVRLAGLRLEMARKEIVSATMSLNCLAANAVQSGEPKTTVAAAAGVSRPTLDSWLSKDLPTTRGT